MQLFIEIISATWVECLLGHAQNPERLLYTSRGTKSVKLPRRGQLGAI